MDDITIPVVVLNDGETFTGLDGCRVVFLTPKEYDKIYYGNAKAIFSKIPDGPRAKQINEILDKLGDI